MTLSVHFAISHPPHIENGVPQGGLIDMICGFSHIPTEIDEMHPDIIDALGGVCSRVTISSDQISFNPGVPPEVAHSVGDTILDNFGATMAA